MIEETITFAADGREVRRTETQIPSDEAEWNAARKAGGSGPDLYAKFLAMKAEREAKNSK